MKSGVQLLAELAGTFWLVFGGVGAAILAADVPNLTVGVTGIALAFGLTLLTMAYVIGPISGCHINPAVTVGLWVSGRFPLSKTIFYILVQTIGAIAAAGLLYAIASGKTGFDISTGPGANGYGEHSPAGYSLLAGFLVEVVLTLGFVFIVLGSTDFRVPKGFGPISVGLALTLVNLIGIPVTNMSVNPARSLGPAVFVGGWAMAQVWLFWAAPLLGAVLAGLIYRFTGLYGREALLVDQQGK